MGCDIIIIDVHVGFQEKLCFWQMGCDIFTVDEWNYCLYLTCVVWRPRECESQAWEKYIYAECDLRLMWLLMTLIDMWWCWCLWWLYEYEMRLLWLLITSLKWDDVYVENNIEMECWWCWKCIDMCKLCMFMGGCIDLVGCPWWGKIEWLKNLSIYEGMLRCFNSSMVMYLTTPTFIRRMLCMFMGGALTLSDVPCGGK